MFFRVTADGIPVIQGKYSQNAEHAVAGYHSFELNYLAHTYICTYVQPKAKPQTLTGQAAFPTTDHNFCLFFQPDKHARQNKFIPKRSPLAATAFRCSAPKLS